MENSTTDQFIGQRIRQARLAAGLNQSQLAAHINRRQRVVSAYEMGEQGINASLLVEIARVLKKPISYFFPADDVTSNDADSATTNI